jgi:hypothetical protein
MKHLITELRAHLVSQGIVRPPSDSGVLPVAWLAPADGTPAPGEGTPASDVVVGIYPAPGTTLGALEQRWLVREGVDVYIRVPAHSQPQALELARAIRRELADRSGFDLGDLRVQQCLERRPVQLVASDEGQGATYVVSFEFLIRDEDQA